MDKNTISDGEIVSSILTLIVLIIGVTLLVSFVSFPFIRAGAYHEGIKYMERQAVKEGLAEYRPDEEGNPTFIWKK